MFVLIRIVLGLIFVVSGVEKVITPYQNFLYVIQGYDILPPGLDYYVAILFPWIELFIGVFVIAGLWLRPALLALLAMTGSLILIVGQAIFRHLPLDSCGCFGELIHMPLRGIILLDATIFLGACLCLRYLDRTRRWSLDALYDKK